MEQLELVKERRDNAFVRHAVALVDACCGSLRRQQEYALGLPAELVARADALRRRWLDCGLLGFSVRRIRTRPYLVGYLANGKQVTAWLDGYHNEWVTMWRR